MIAAMIKLLLAIAAYAVFTTVLIIIERIQDRRRPPQAPEPEEPLAPADRTDPSPRLAPDAEPAEEPERSLVRS